MELTLNDTENWILNALNNFADAYFDQENRSGTFVTYSIKEIIGNYGHSKGFKVCACGFPGHFENEWLYDMVWYKENNTNNLITVELALECEQSYGLPAIKFDFEKLLVANANLRIMICLLGKMPVEIIKDYCTNAVNAYTHLKKGDRILTLIWDDFGAGNFIPHLTIKDK